MSEMDNTNLAPEQKGLLQQIMDAHCTMIYDRYLQERKEEDELFIQQATEFTGTLSQYPALGSAPHERVFLEAASESIRRCRDELRQVSAIYKTLGLKTNCHLHRVLGYKSQEHKSELQGV